MNLDNLKTTTGIDVSGKRVIVRADLNVPAANGVVTDATRLERIVPGLADLASRGAKVIVVSHFGRPKAGPEAEFSLAPVAAKLAELMGGRSIGFVPDCIGETAAAGVAALANGDIVVLENLRFHKGEEKNDPGFVSALAAHGDIYVNDAFSCAHRAHASTEGLAHVLPAYAGPLMMEEINAIRRATETGQRPIAAVVGGAKVSTKIEVLTNLAAKVDTLIIGGGMANTFLQALGVFMGQSLAEPEFHATARQIMAEAKERGTTILLPTDGVIAREFKAGAANEVVSVHKIPIDAMLLDVGPASVAKMTEALSGCRTLMWNGPMGAFEIEPFGAGTFSLAREAARLTKAGQLTSVAGGGDTVAALNMAGVTDDFTYVSSAGGAFLEWLEGKELPGVAALAK
jgi:phosphoglycerate kinase